MKKKGYYDNIVQATIGKLNYRSMRRSGRLLILFKSVLH